MWDIAKELGIFITSAISVMTLLIGYFLSPRRGYPGSLREEWVEFQRDLLTVIVLSYLISASFIYLYGNLLAHFNLEQYVRATVMSALSP